MTSLHFSLELGTCRDVAATTERVSPEWVMKKWVTKTWIPKYMVFNGDPSTTNGGIFGSVNDFQGTPNKDSDDVYPGESPHVYMAPCGGYMTSRGQPAEHKVPCPQVHDAGSARPSSSVLDIRDQAPRIYGVPRRAGCHGKAEPNLGDRRDNMKGRWDQRRGAGWRAEVETGSE